MVGQRSGWSSDTVSSPRHEPTRGSARLMANLHPRLRPAISARSEKLAPSIVHIRGAGPRIYQLPAAGGVAISQAHQRVQERGSASRLHGDGELVEEAGGNLSVAIGIF